MLASLVAGVEAMRFSLIPAGAGEQVVAGSGVGAVYLAEDAPAAVPHHQLAQVDALPPTRLLLVEQRRAPGDALRDRGHADLPWSFSSGDADGPARRICAAHRTVSASPSPVPNERMSRNRTQCCSCSPRWARSSAPDRSPWPGSHPAARSMTGHGWVCVSSVRAIWRRGTVVTSSSGMTAFRFLVVLPLPPLATRRRSAGRTGGSRTAGAARRQGETLP